MRDLDHGIPANERIDSFLRNPAGSDPTDIDMAVDGSTPVNFEYQVAENHWAVLTRLLGDIGGNAMQWDEFGNIDLSEGNGLTLKVFASNGTTLVYDLLDGHPIIQNSQWSNRIGPDGPMSFAAGPDSVPLRWTFRKAGYPLRLEDQQILRATVSDDLSTLATFTLAVQGYLIDLTAEG